MEYVRYVAKAISAAVTAGGAALTLALLDGKVDGGELTTIVVGTVVAACAVFIADNGPKPAS